MAVSRSTTAALMMAPLLLLARTVSAGPAAAADCVAHPTAVVVHGDARFTVLTDRVVRAERAPFVDDCTFTIVRRATPSVPAFTHGLRADGVLEINTTQLRLTFNASAVPRHPPPPPPCTYTWTPISPAILHRAPALHVDVGVLCGVFFQLPDSIAY